MRQWLLIVVGFALVACSSTTPTPTPTQPQPTALEVMTQARLALAGLDSYRFEWTLTTTRQTYGRDPIEARTSAVGQRSGQRLSAIRTNSDDPPKIWEEIGLGDKSFVKRTPSTDDGGDWVQWPTAGSPVEKAIEELLGALKQVGWQLGGEVNASDEYVLTRKRATTENQTTEELRTVVHLSKETLFPVLIENSISSIEKTVGGLVWETSEYTSWLRLTDHNAAIEIDLPTGVNDSAGEGVLL